MSERLSRRATQGNGGHAAPRSPRRRRPGEGWPSTPFDSLGLAHHPSAMARRTEIRRDFRFEAAHRLPMVPEGHKCGRMHGHSFVVSVVVGGEVHPELGWIVDFAEIDEAIKPLRAQLDHHILNEVPGLENPTSELLAAWVMDRIQLSRGQVRAVEVQETCCATCTVYAG